MRTGIDAIKQLFLILEINNPGMLIGALPDADAQSGLCNTVFLYDTF